MMRGTMEDIAYQLAALAAAHARRECNNPKACVHKKSELLTPVWTAPGSQFCPAAA